MRQVDELLKQRLIGALILLALGVVFWPIIFVEPEPVAGLQPAPVPPRPAVDSTPLEPPDPVGLRPSPSLSAQPPEPDGDSAPSGGSSDATAADAGPMPAAALAPATEPSPAAGNGRRTRAEPPATPALDSDGVPIAWILQVATLSREDRAEALRVRLIEAGHKAYIKRVRREDRTLYRVYIGPGFEKARIEKLKPEIDAELKVNSLVQRYYP